jgi:S-adenosylmethionine:tRNA ribosyltransferase-isomerase
MHPANLRIEDYSYELPEERIARYPLEERDASRLLIYRDGVIAEDRYRNIARHIPEGMLVVFNQTRVVHARLLFRKPTGGVIEVFCLAPGEAHADMQTAMQQQEHVSWQCLVGGAAKWKKGVELSLPCPDAGFTLYARMADRREDHFVLDLRWDRPELSFAEVLQHAGRVPLPPYIQRAVEPTDAHRYQTIFAREEGSVAAPTAGLHFTDRILEDLRMRAIDMATVTLHVGAGTFRPVKTETMQDHSMHAEWMDVELDVIERIKGHLDKGIVATGTTSLRTLESIYWIGAGLLSGSAPDPTGIGVHQWQPYEMDSKVSAEEALSTLAAWLRENGAQRLVTRTQLLIAPGYRFRIAKGLVTNFHQPRSTLLLLVAAFVGAGWRDVYRYALDNDFRFLSYGDGCLLWNGTAN